jgi:hypothetical protein
MHPSQILIRFHMLSKLRLPARRYLAAGKRSDTLSFWTHPHFTSKLHRSFVCLNKRSIAVRGRIRLKTCGGALLLCFLFFLGAASICYSVWCYLGVMFQKRHSSSMHQRWVNSTSNGNIAECSFCLLFLVCE